VHVALCRKVDRGGRVSAEGPSESEIKVISSKGKGSLSSGGYGGHVRKEDGG